MTHIKLEHLTWRAGILPMLLLVSIFATVAYARPLTCGPTEDGPTPIKESCMIGNWVATTEGGSNCEWFMTYLNVLGPREFSRNVKETVIECEPGDSEIVINANGTYLATLKNLKKLSRFRLLGSVGVRQNGEAIFIVDFMTSRGYWDADDQTGKAAVCLMENSGKGNGTIEMPNRDRISGALNFAPVRLHTLEYTCDGDKLSVIIPRPKGSSGVVQDVRLVLYRTKVLK